MKTFDGQGAYKRKSGTYKTNEVLVSDRDYIIEDGNTHCISPFFKLIQRIAKDAEIGAIKEGENRFMHIDTRIDYQSEMFDLPCIIRHKIPINLDLNDEKKQFMKSRRIVVNPIAVEELSYTELRVPEELFHLPFEGGCVIQFEGSGSSYEFNGIKFNHVSILDLGDGRFHLASYSEDGHGPLQFEFSLNEISDKESFINGKTIEKCITEKFANIVEVAEFNDRGQLVLSAEDQINFVRAYFGNYSDIISEVQKRSESYRNPLGVSIETDSLFASVYTTLVQFAMDEMGISTIKNQKIEQLERRVFSYSEYWYEVTSSIFRLMSLLNIKEFDEQPFDISENSFTARSRRKIDGERKTRRMPYLLISSTSNSNRHMIRGRRGKQLDGSVLVRGHTRRQWIKHTGKFSKVHYRNRHIGTESVKSPYVIKWIKWFWKGKEHDKILTGAQVSVGSQPSAISFHENRMVEILISHFGGSFSHDKHHEFMLGPDNKRYRLDGFVDSDTIRFGVEVDGLQHFEYVPIFHRRGPIDLEKQQRTDEEKDALCEKANIPLARIDSREWDGEESSFWELLLPQLPDNISVEIGRLIEN